MPKIFIDIGHGGKDPGAINSKETEKHINLIVGSRLGVLLQEQGFEVKWSRQDDSFIDLTPRCDMANKWGADLFISIHHNAGSGNGYECIHSIHHGVGETLAKLVAYEFIKLGQEAHGVGVYDKAGTKNPNQDYYAVIRQTHMPAIITEYAYMDSRDFDAVDTLDEQFAEAQAICNAVCKYYGKEYEVRRMAEQAAHWAQPLLDKAVKKGIITAEHDLDKPFTLAELLSVLNKLGELE
jgi:N-acetylmuramoyl-L-alanine amidase